MVRSGKVWLGAALLGAVLTVTACGGTTPVSGGTATNTGGPSTVTLTGAGSTFDYPLFSKMFSEYSKQHPDLRVNYQSIGSGGGQNALFAGTVAFGASDGYLSDQQMKEHPSVLHIPITLGAVSVGYNLPGVDGLRLSGDALAKLYLGQIKQWNDPELVALNPGVKLPNLPVAVVHRSDGSGTTFIFTNYLKAVSNEWSQKVGAGTSVNWPVGIGAKGSEGVAGQVRQTPGAIGYFEMAYSMQNKIQQALMQNKDGQFLPPSVAGTTAAAAGAVSNMPADLRALFVNAPGKESYPIAGFSWVLVDSNQKDPVQGKKLAELLWWMIHDGQQYATALYYAPLPAPIVKLDEQQIQKLTYNGTPLWQSK